MIASTRVLTRRRVLVGAGVLAAGAAVGGVSFATRPRTDVSLGQEGLALTSQGVVTELGRDDLLVPGTRVLRSAEDADELAARQLAWLAGGRVPTVPELSGSSMISDALLDLAMLGTGQAAPVAGWSPPWRFVWPRDSSIVAVALARTGRPADAARVLDWLQHVQAPDGTFQARYRSDGTPPDGRGVQLDGTGWALWSLTACAAALPEPERTALLEQHRTLLDRSGTLLSTLAQSDRLPISPDYWELPERRPTLATSALTLAGLESASTAWRLLGDVARAEQTTTLSNRFADRVFAAFAPGFPRHLGGSPASVDLGVAFVLPPFRAVADPRATRAWRRSLTRMARPAGGLAPGGSWVQDGVSWTPTTGTAAMVAAAVGDREEAIRLLRWLDDHRTSQGAIPEKVLADGRPAEVAPLAWSAAATIIAADELDHG